MALLTNRSRLDVQAEPSAPPWWFMPARAVEYWLGVSGQTLANWRGRGTGPDCYKGNGNRVWYRVADVRTWLGDARELEAQYRDYLKSRESDWSLLKHPHGTDAYRSVYGCLDKADRVRAIRLVMKDTAKLEGDELDELLPLLDRAGVFGRPAAPIGCLKPVHLPQKRFANYFGSPGSQSASALLTHSG